MNSVAPVVAGGVSVAFKTTKHENPKADDDHRVVVAGIDNVRADRFKKELFAIIPNHNVWEHDWAQGGGTVIVDLPANSQMSKYQFMDKVIEALQKVGINISD